MAAPAPKTLAGWLEYLEQLHPQAIEMGLERVATVARSLGIAPEFPLITVGGTNGKGSCCAMLESILAAAGYRVGCYTSPHLVRYNERVRIDGSEAEDGVFCRAFAAIEEARGDISLTYFEFGTLAAMLAFCEAKVDVAILEVGLGGRLDAVNIFDADCALVASVDLDHQNYLGDTREAIGFEKAGIFRSARAAVCGDADPPSTLVEHARAIGADLYVIDRDFGYVADGQQWRYWGPAGKRHGLPHPALRGAFQLGNAASCITALECLASRLPVTLQDIRNGLVRAEVTGRFQVMPGVPLVVLDVAHNPHAARALAANLAGLPGGGRTFAVFAMLNDKDIAGVIDAVKDRISGWYLATTPGNRGTDKNVLAAHLAAAGVQSPVKTFDDVVAAWRSACKSADGNDKIIVFGSFLTVAAVLSERQRKS